MTEEVERDLFFIDSYYCKNGCGSGGGTSGYKKQMLEEKAKPKLAVLLLEYLKILYEIQKTEGKKIDHLETGPFSKLPGFDIPNDHRNFEIIECQIQLVDKEKGSAKIYSPTMYVASTVGSIGEARYLLQTLKWLQEVVIHFKDKSTYKCVIRLTGRYFPNALETYTQELERERNLRLGIPVQISSTTINCS